MKRGRLKAWRYLKACFLYLLGLRSLLLFCHFSIHSTSRYKPGMRGQPRGKDGGGRNVPPDFKRSPPSRDTGSWDKRGPQFGRSPSGKPFPQPDVGIVEGSVGGRRLDDPKDLKKIGKKDTGGGSGIDGSDTGSQCLILWRGSMMNYREAQGKKTSSELMFGLWYCAHMLLEGRAWVCIRSF